MKLDFLSQETACFPFHRQASELQTALLLVRLYLSLEGQDIYALLQGLCERTKLVIYRDIEA